MKKLFIFLFICLIQVSIAQTTEDIDELYAGFDSNHPAVAAVVLHKGEIIYQKAYGSVNLDHKIPATIDTKFQLGGLSKHFVAYATFLLEERGIISLDDDIRKYVSDLPRYDDKITISHLLSQTSGFPDFWTMKNIAGWHRDDVFTQAHAMDMIKQMRPAFKPGEDYIYSNTNQLLLAEIIASASGKSFSEFLNEELFQPLDMTNTVVLDDFEQYIPNVAASYEPTESGFKRSALNYGIVGPTNVYSSVSDLAKWELNLRNPKIGSKKMIERLYADCNMNSGETMDPLFGRLTFAQQLYHLERGIPNYYQTGTLGGYASSIFKFIDSEFTTIVLSSGMPYSGYLGMQTAYLYLEDEFVTPGNIDYANLKTKKLSSSQLERHTGTYWNEKSGYSRSIALKDDTLRYVRGENNESTLLPLSKDEFQMISFGDEKITVRFSGTGVDKTMSLTIGESASVYGMRVAPFAYNSEDLKAFTGTYYCKPLSTVYEFTVEGGRLTAKNLRAGTITFNPIKEGLFESDQWFFGGIQFEENESRIEGFTLSLEEVPSLWFKKVSS
ncbi:serine hydrolase domain-containing protein [Ekhidna sp.]